MENGKIKKNWLKIIFNFVLISLIFPLFSFADSGLDVMNFAKLERYVNDFAKAMPETDRSLLNERAAAIESGTTAQIVTVLFPERQGNELYDIALKLFRDNGIGQADTNNGLLLTIATDEKKIRITVGYGLEGIFTDALSREIIENTIRPLVNEGNLVEAVSGFYSQVEAILANPEEFQTSETDYANSYENNDRRMIAGLFIGFIGSLITLFGDSKKKMRITDNLLRIILGGFAAPYILSGLSYLLFLGSRVESFLVLGHGIISGTFVGFIIYGLFSSGGGSGGGYSGGSSSSRSSSSSSSSRSSSSSSSSSGFSGGGGSSGGGGAGD